MKGEDNMLEARELLMDLHLSCKKREQFCREAKKKYNPPYKTDDKYEAGSHEYWRGRENVYREQANDILHIIQTIDNLLKEDLTNLEAYEEYLKDLKGVF